MEWLISSTEFKRRDRSYFSFNSSPNFEVNVIKIEQNENGKVDFQPEKINSVSEYGAWIKACRPHPTGPHRPTLLLVMHKRIGGNNSSDGFDKSAPLRLAYNEHEFQTFCTDLCQHRTLSSIVARQSTAVFSCRQAIWQGSDSFGHSTVFHCKSDTESFIGNDNIVLSTTCFTDVPVTFAVMYGCTQDLMEDITLWLERCEESVFHPLVLPMVFAEHERKRLFNVIDKKSTKLGERILELEKRVRKDPKKNIEQDAEEGQGRRPMTQRDCEAINLWRSMSSIKNGLESLHTELGSMRDHLHPMPKFLQKQSFDPGGLQSTGQGPEVHIDARLKEMMAEFRSKVRSCEGLLGSMTLATQMEWNFYTRRDAQVNYSIATATRMDSSQMKQISLLGMVFLPGTFLATFFSMTFFSWMPEDSGPKTSPWLALYGGLTLLLTSGTIFWFKYWSKPEDNARKSMQKFMEKNMENTLFSRLTFQSSSSSVKTMDIEKGGAD
ncbi:hypothetical protein F5883DRAFT_574562 [Diaporthe sp. PMI_573]|nr:hypothetical protein F5883DRAFT_574562 [Diaporthaceae sp. PMI_573]